MFEIKNDRIISTLDQLELPRNEKINTKASKVLQKLCEEESIKLSDQKFSNFRRNIERSLKRKSLSNNRFEEHDEWSKKVCIIINAKDCMPSDEHSELDPVQLQQPSNSSDQRRSGAGGRPSKRLSDEPAKKTCNKILDEHIKGLELQAEAEGIDKHKFLSMLKQRCLVKWGPDPEPSTSVENEEEKIRHAVGVIYNLDLSINQYQELRLSPLMQKSIPSRLKVSQFKSKLVSDSMLKIKPNQTSWDIDFVIKQTVDSIVKNKSPNSKSVKVTGKYGPDGSGGHSYRHQRDKDESNSSNNDRSYISSFWCPLDIIDNDTNEVIFSNPVPNSILYSRPVELIKAKESRENVKLYLKPTLDKIAEIENNEITTELGIQCQCFTNISMCDEKMISLLHGDSGAYCHLCTCKKADGNDVLQISQGFEMNKTYEDMLETWKEILKEEEIKKDKKDQGKRYRRKKDEVRVDRKGQLHEPLIGHNNPIHGILHSKLRIFDGVCLKLFWRLISGARDWSEKANVEPARTQAIEKIRDLTGMLLDTPTSDGGNTNTGPLSDRFFSPEERQNICSVIPDESDRANFSELLSKLNVFFSVTQHVTDDLVDPMKVKELGYNIQLFYKECWPWAIITNTFHQACSHYWELFVLTEGRSIARYSEQGSESYNKYIRYYKSGPGCKARQSSETLNLRDIFVRIALRSHPEIAMQKRVFHCKKCNQYGHTIRSCKADYVIVKSYEQQQIADCFLK